MAGVVAEDGGRGVVGTGALHHVELWVPDLARAERSWGWLLTALGYTAFQRWDHGRSWRHPGSGTYVVVEQSPALRAATHERTRPGLNHLAFTVAADEFDRLVQDATVHGWTLLFGERHPFAGGPDHRAAYLADVDGFEVELVAAPVAPASVTNAQRSARF